MGASSRRLSLGRVYKRFTLPFVGAGFRTILGTHASVNVLAGYRYQKNAFGLEDITAHDILLTFGLSVFPNGIQ